MVPVNRRPQPKVPVIAFKGDTDRRRAAARRILGHQPAAAGHFHGARQPGPPSALTAAPASNTTQVIRVTPEEEIAALDAEIARYEKALNEAGLTKAKRRDLKQLLATLRAMRQRILREG
jgi:hypothetical protein